MDGKCGGVVYLLFFAHSLTSLAWRHALFNVDNSEIFNP